MKLSLPYSRKIILAYGAGCLPGPRHALQVHVVVRLLTTLACPVRQDRAQFCGSSEANPIWSHNPLSGPLEKKKD